MAHYIITRTALEKRFASGGATVKESALIISAIFSYLEQVSNSTKFLPFEEKVINLSFYDFRFLYSLYTNDDFARRFFSVFRDLNNKSIEYSQSISENDRIIRDSTGLGDHDNGLYLYVLNFDKHMATAITSNALSYSILNPGESINSLSMSSINSEKLLAQAVVVPRTDDMKSYTDSVVRITPSLPKEVSNESLFPDSYKQPQDAGMEVPFMNGTPGTVTKERIRSSNSNPIKQATVNSVDSSDSRLSRTDLAKYPVLNFLLNRNKTN